MPCAVARKMVGTPPHRSATRIGADLHQGDVGQEIAQFCWRKRQIAVPDASNQRCACCLDLPDEFFLDAVLRHFGGVHRVVVPLPGDLVRVHDQPTAGF